MSEIWKEFKETYLRNKELREKKVWKNEKSAEKRTLNYVII